MVRTLSKKGKEAKGDLWEELIEKNRFVFTNRLQFNTFSLSLI